MIIEGNVGIGTTNPGANKLDVEGGNIYAGGGNDVCTSTQCLNALSDARLKTNIQPLGSALDKVMQLRPITYLWNQTYLGSHSGVSSLTSTKFGFIAQDVQQLFPDIVTQGPDGYLGLDYNKFAPILTQAIQEQQGEIDEISNSQFLISDEIQSLNDQNVGMDDKLKIISNSFTAIDSRTTQNETDITNLKTNLATAETKLQEAENNLATFETSVNDTLSAMLETENMLTERILGHEDRIKALEDKVATLTVTSGGQVPANVVTQDEDGNVTLAGIFKAKIIQTEGVVAGSYAVKNDGTKKVIGTSKIPDGEKKITIETTAAASNSQIFVTPKVPLGQSLAVVSIDDGKSFTVEMKDAEDKDIEFFWWIVEER